MSARAGRRVGDELNVNQETKLNEARGFVVLVVDQPMDVDVARRIVTVRAFFSVQWSAFGPRGGCARAAMYISQWSDECYSNEEEHDANEK